MTQNEFDYLNALVAKMDRIAEQRGRTFTSTADLNADERCTYRRLQVLADAENAIQQEKMSRIAFPSRPA